MNGQDSFHSTVVLYSKDRGILYFPRGHTTIYPPDSDAKRRHYGQRGSERDAPYLGMATQGVNSASSFLKTCSEPAIVGIYLSYYLQQSFIFSKVSFECVL